MPVAKYCGIVTFAFCAVLPLMAKAGTLTTLYTFMNGTDGGNPVGVLSYDHGALYGTTSVGNGNVFKIDAATGQFKVVHSFQGGADGALPYHGVVYAGGMLYGTTEDGGGSSCTLNYPKGCGTIFSIDPKTDAEAVLYEFPRSVNGTENVEPGSLLYLAGTLYGITKGGGTYGNGSVFSFNPTSASFTTLYSLTGGADGNDPNPQLLYENSLLYGATSYGGTGCAHLGGCGTIFTVNPATGVETVLYEFKYGKTGKVPYSNFIYHAGWLTGDTLIGGDRQSCRNGCGVNFKVKVATGRETLINTFTNRGESYSGMTQAQGAVYGTLPYGGSGYGALAQLDLTSGQQTVLYTFTGGADGRYPQEALTYHDGVLYGTTLSGADGGNPGCLANEGCGTVFKFVP
jgi:uncharacterized repeat protein (TIGR03803 family)